MALLSIEGLSLHFGGVIALDKVSLEIQEGEIHGLIGPNGAGKTSLMNCISRFYTPTAGKIQFAGGNLLKARPFDLSKLGIRRSFQDPKLNPNLSVMDNLRIGQQIQYTTGFLQGLFKLKSYNDEARTLNKNLRDILRFFRAVREQTELPQKDLGYPDIWGRAGYPDLIDLEDMPTGTLPFAPKKRADLARAIAIRPKLLLLDEPAAGTRHSDLPELIALIRKIRDEFKTSILLVEHNIPLVLELCDVVTALDFGKRITSGPPQDVVKNEDVIKAYIGSGKNIQIGSETPVKLRDATTKYILETKKIDVNYGSIQALSNASVQIEAGAIVTVLGANGAGKSTLLKAISGVEVLSEGELIFDGQKIADRAFRVKPHQAVKLGIACVAEGRQIFPDLSVKSNLILGSYLHAKGFKENMERSLSYFPNLKEKLSYRAGMLSGGEQQMLAVAQALMAQPKLLLLDEPSLGLSPALVEKLFQIIIEINRREGMTILLVEQNVYQALQISSYGYVLETGRVIQSGYAADLAKDSGIRRAYLGGS